MKTKTKNKNKKTHTSGTVPKEANSISLTHIFINDRLLCLAWHRWG